MKNTSRQWDTSLSLSYSGDYLRCNSKDTQNAHPSSPQSMQAQILKDKDLSRAAALAIPWLQPPLYSQSDGACWLNPPVCHWSITVFTIQKSAWGVLTNVTAPQIPGRLRGRHLSQTCQPEGLEYLEESKMAMGQKDLPLNGWLVEIHMLHGFYIYNIWVWFWSGWGLLQVINRLILQLQSLPSQKCRMEMVP